MSSDDTPDLPVAAKFKWKPMEEPLEKELELTTWADNFIDRSEEPRNLVLESDAEEAIRQREEQVRQRILEKIKQKIEHVTHSKTDPSKIEQAKVQCLYDLHDDIKQKQQQKEEKVDE